MSAASAGNLVFIEGIMDQHMYLKNFQENVHAGIETLGLGELFIF